MWPEVLEMKICRVSWAKPGTGQTLPPVVRRSFKLRPGRKMWQKLCRLGVHSRNVSFSRCVCNLSPGISLVILPSSSLLAWRTLGEKEWNPLATDTVGKRAFCSRGLSLRRQPACTGIWGEPQVWQPFLLPEHLCLSVYASVCFLTTVIAFAKKGGKKRARVSFSSLQVSSSRSEGKFLYCWRAISYHWNYRRFLLKRDG